MHRATEKTRICCFCEKWESGGIESFLCNMISHMDLQTLELDIVASCLADSVFTQRLESLGVHFFELSGSQRNVLGNAKRFRALLAQRHYDVVHLNIFQSLSLYYAKVAKDMGIPLRIAHSHNTALRSSKTKWLKTAVHNGAKRAFTAYATNLWACSEDAARFCFYKTELDKHGFRFIPNGINLKKYAFHGADRAAFRSEHALQNRFVVGHMGRLCDQKNQSFTLDIFAELAKHRPESVLLLVGEGEDRNALQKKADLLGLHDKVIFCGATTSPESLYQAMDVFLFPSKFEGFGIVLLEAQAAGLPVVCSDNIPKEVRLSPHMVCLSLEADACQWSSAVLKAGEKVLNRADAPELSAFESSEVAKSIAEEYRRASKNDSATKPIV